MKSIKNKWFTLVELIVWVTISAILMISIWIFASSWMNNIFTQQKVLDNLDYINSFWNKLNLNFIISDNSKFNILTSTWVLFKRNQNFDRWGFSIISEKTMSWFYCDALSDTHETNHIFIKEFIPYEEVWEDIYSNYSDTIESSISISWDTYRTDMLNHIVQKNWINIIWKWVFGNELFEWEAWTWSYLNSPSWITHGENKIFISDTLNNRVLYYDLSSETIHNLLDESDGILEPTWILYDAWKLYISNSWKWEVLELNSESSSSWELSLYFSPESDLNNVNKIEIEFLTWAISIDSPNEHSEIWDISFDNISIWVLENSFLTWSTNSISYYFNRFFIPSPSVEITSNCSSFASERYYLTWDNPTRDNITCSPPSFSTWTLIKYDWTRVNKNLTSWNNYWINISNISWSWLDENKPYYTRLSIFDWTNLLHQKYFPYFQISDSDISTMEDNNLIVLTWWLSYPTWLAKVWPILEINDFWDRKKYRINTNTNSVLPEINLSFVDINSIDLDNSLDKILKTPIKNLEIQKDTNDLLHLNLEYYKKYDCYNPENSSIRTYLLKKDLK